MTRRIRVPGLVDIVRTGDPAVIRALSEDPRLDRAFDGGGPLVNRVVAGRIRSAFQFALVPFAAVAPRDYPGRAERQLRLERELAGRLAAAGPAPEQLGLLVACIRGEMDDDALGRTAQEAVGRLFAPDYVATDETWRAACLLDSAPRTLNPLRRLRWALSGAIGRSQRTLARGVDGDPAAMHATGVALHTLVRSLREMRELWRDPAARGSVSAETAAARSLRAPERVARRWTGRAMTVVGEVRPGALAIFDLDDARSHRPGPPTAFMAGSWSQCPAHAWVPALLQAVWIQAAAQAGLPDAAPEVRAAS